MKVKNFLHLNQFIIDDDEKHFYAFIKEYAGIDIDRKTMDKLENGKIDNFINGFFFIFDKNVKDFEKSLID